MFESLISSLSLLALFLGAIAQSVSILILFGFLAQQDKFNLILVIIIGTLGSFVGHQMFFMIGRFLGERVINKKRVWKRKAVFMSEKIERYESLSIIILRFVQGLKILSSIFFGTTKINRFRFMALNLIASFLWVCIFVFVGFFFGLTAHKLIGEIGSIQNWVILGILGISVLYWLARRQVKR
ncbi:MAG TPA: VTT domain-containing protein [Candidatus Nanoarchaeia archaeon]|nr:VTT domain-containing protein [Candidatus Nanoarchaeia archaeon]